MHCTLRILEAIRTFGTHKQIKFYQLVLVSYLVHLLTSEQQTPSCPSPYAAAKLFILDYYQLQKAYDLYASNGILFNHESPRRGELFVTRKITRALVSIKLGIQECLYLGNLDAKRDWGHASTM